MVAIRATFFIENGKNGASESFWLDAADLTVALTKADALAQIRARLFGNSGQLTYIRVSREGVFRDAQVAIARYSGDPADIADGAKGVALFNGGISEPMWSSILCRGVNGDFYRSPFYLRNAPQLLFTASDIINLDPAWAKGFETFRKKLIADQWGMLAASKEGDHPEFPITGAAIANGQLSFTVLGAPGWVVGDKVSTRTINWIKPNTVRIAAPLTITAINIGTYVCSGAISGTGTYKSGGFARKWDRIFRPFSDAFVERATRRASGRSFFLQRGRRPAASFR